MLYAKIPAGRVVSQKAHVDLLTTATGAEQGYRPGMRAAEDVQTSLFELFREFLGSNGFEPLPVPPPVEDALHGAPCNRKTPCHDKDGLSNSGVTSPRPTCRFRTVHGAASISG
jgi:hypothetical protein